MSLDFKEVAKIARLAKLSLSDQEVSLYASQLVKILDSMAELSRLDVSGVSAAAGAFDFKNDLREDDPAAFAETAALLKNAPERDGPYFKVPRVIEES